jgi:hypothetical protein
MEREFYTDDFENLLKENADQFKMAPSKKVWHGIYNDLHPGRRWPSAAMSLIIIFSLVIVSNLNNSRSKRNSLPNLQKGQLQTVIEKISNNSVEQSENKIYQTNTIDQKNYKAQKNSKVTLKKSFATSKIDLLNKEEQIVENKIFDSKNNNDEIIAFGPNTTGINDLNNVTGNGIQEEVAVPVILTNSSLNAIILAENNNAVNKFAEANSRRANHNSKTISNFSQNESVHVPILRSPRNTKVSWMYYLSPAFSFRTYSNHDEGRISNSDVVHHPAFGFEAGSMMKYALSKKLKFTSGFQANYSAYTIQAHNTHPVMATLLLYDKQDLPYSISSISFYANGPGNAIVDLENYTLQISLPVGLEYKLAGNNDDVQLNAFATFQPSFIVANRAYLLSTDKKNYITQSPLSNKFNAGTNFGTFVSFNSNKFSWQIGPQIRYQLFSSYKNAYRVREHFIDYGIRVGVSNLIR